jgi:hypothetical protein
VYSGHIGDGLYRPPCARIVVASFRSRPPHRPMLNAASFGKNDGTMRTAPRRGLKRASHA